ncbi:hypothetical protein [Komagataeibacter kakiaceti]
MVLLLLTGLAGCGGFGKILSDSTELPGSLPNTPRAEGENMRRVVGQAPQVLPILPQARNIWPVIPATGQAMLAMDDGAAPSPMPPPAPDLPAGGEMQIGNDGVQLVLPGRDSRVSTLSSSPPATHKDVSDAAIVVPNGDGTSTVVAPDGTVQEQRTD